MPVLKVKNNGEWEYVGAFPNHTHTISDITDFPSDLPTTGGDADTLDGKHADEFASASDVETLKTQVGNTSVSEQINDAVAQKSQVQMITSTDTENIIENLSTLQIHKLTEEQYQQMVEDGTIDENTLYLTPDEEVDLSGYATKDELDTKADSSHNHDSSYDAYGSANMALNDAKYYTDSEIAEWVGSTTVSAQIGAAIANKADSTHNHNDSYDIKGSANTALEDAKTYTDNAVAQKSQVQIITWEDDD